MAARRAMIRVPLEVEPARLRIALQDRSRMFLEGGPGFKEAGRWSYFGLDAFETLSGNASDVIALGHLAGIDGPSIDPDDPPFQGGWIGYLGYDLGRAFETLPRQAAQVSRLPDFHFERFDVIAVLDEFTGSAEILAGDDRDQGETALSRRVDQIRRNLEDVAPRTSIRAQAVSRLTSNFTRDDYLQTVRRALEYIRAGDIFQVNLSQRFEMSGQFDARDLYRRLKRRSPAPYAAFLDLGDAGQILSASPELFFQTRGEHIVTRPIKGTRPRGQSPEHDLAMAEELRSSAKDNAELTMIVDLERNDLGRICEYGSVQVVQDRAIESYAQVHHLVATVAGRLRQGITLVDILRAMFPGGSITGAPKIRAMEIIDELEPSRRNLYTGSIGYVDRSGDSAFNIAIRTMVVENGRASFQVGGGIVADSDPEAEYEETLHKGRALREVLEELAS